MEQLVREYVEQEVAIKIWIEKMLDVALPNNYWPTLADGVLLCKLMLRARPRSIPVIYEENTNSFFRIRNNICFFLEACEEELNLAKRYLFDVYDLYQQKNVTRVVSCLLRINDAVVALGWDGPCVNLEISAERLKANMYLPESRARALVQLLLQKDSTLHVVRRRKPDATATDPVAISGGSIDAEVASATSGDANKASFKLALPALRKTNLWHAGADSGMTPRASKPSTAVAPKPAFPALRDTSKLPLVPSIAIEIAQQDKELVQELPHEQQQQQQPSSELDDATPLSPSFDSGLLSPPPFLDESSTLIDDGLVPIRDLASSFDFDLEGEQNIELDMLLALMEISEPGAECDSEAASHGTDSEAHEAAPNRFLRNGPFARDAESGFVVLDEETSQLVGEALTPIQAVVRGNIARKAYRKRVRNEAYRSQVAAEILSTEKDYINNLRILMHAFLIPLTTAFPNAEGTVALLRTLLSEVQVILGYGMKLLKEIQPLVLGWNPRQCLGHVFMRITDYMKVYTQYVKDFSPCMEAIVVSKDKDSAFTAKLKELELMPEIASRGLPFESYLILPVQRIPRYQLLLNDMVSHTEPDHPDYRDLSAAKQKMKIVGEFVNEQQKQYEALHKVVEISHKFNDLPDLVQSHRKLVREGELWRYPETNKRDTWFLFSDVLLIGTKADRRGKKYRLRHLIQLKQFTVSGISTTDPTLHVFGLIERDTARQVLVQALASSKTEKSSWMMAINKQLLELESSGIRKSDPSAPSSPAPSERSATPERRASKTKRRLMRSFGKAIADDETLHALAQLDATPAPFNEAPPAPPPMPTFSSLPDASPPTTTAGRSRHRRGKSFDSSSLNAIEAKSPKGKLADGLGSILDLVKLSNSPSPPASEQPLSPSGEKRARRQTTSRFGSLLGYLSDKKKSREQPTSPRSDDIVSSTPSADSTADIDDLGSEEGSTQQLSFGSSTLSETDGGEAGSLGESVTFSDAS